MCVTCVRVNSGSIGAAGICAVFRLSEGTVKTRSARSRGSLDALSLRSDVISSIKILSLDVGPKIISLDVGPFSLMTSGRKLKASREGSKCRNYRMLSRAIVACHYCT